MKKLNGLIIGILLTGVLLLPSCKKDSEDVKTNETTTSASMVQTSLAGVVVDENNNPVQNASIVAYGKTSVTDSRGIFTIKNLDVNAGRCYVKVDKSGYFPASKAVAPVKNGITQIRVMMMDNMPQYSVSSSTGGSAVLSNGCKVDLPVNAVVDVAGNAYNGMINVAVKHLDPTSTNFSNVMPGDLQAIRTDGSNASLMSYGMLGVELTGTSGQKLQMATGKQASITITVPTAMVGAAPSSIPLWHFDETSGIWKEEGEAVLTGNQYVGTVSHFSFWNYDMPYPSATMKGKVVDCNGNPLAGVYIQGYLSAGRSGYIITDANGEFCETIPSTLLMTLSIDASQNFGMSVSPITVGPLTAGEVYTVPTITMNCPASLSGTIVDCDNNPVAGTVLVIWNTGWNLITTLTGEFNIPVQGGQSANIYVYTASGVTNAGTVVTTPAMNVTLNVGVLMACEVVMNNSFYITGGVYNNELITINIDYLQSGSKYYTSNNSTYVSAEQPDGGYKYFGFSVPGQTTGNYNITSGSGYFSLWVSGGIGLDSLGTTNMNVNIQQYGNVGGIVSGTFSGTMLNYGATVTSYTITGGQFAVIRKPDQ